MIESEKSKTPSFNNSIVRIGNRELKTCENVQITHVRFHVGHFKNL
jgi:hypothetical protein